MLQAKRRTNGVVSIEYGVGECSGFCLAGSMTLANTLQPTHPADRGVRSLETAQLCAPRAHFVDYNDAYEVVRKRDQDIPWTAQRGLHDIVHFPR